MTLWDATPLPRGRHNLAREDVTSAQRARIFSGLTQSVAERGYAETSVAEIIRRAGVSRETFYQLFESKQDCFLQALDRVTESFLVHLRRELDSDAINAQEAFAGLLAGYLGTIADDTDRSRVFMVESLTAGADAVVARDGIHAMFVGEILRITTGGEDAPHDVRFAVEAWVAALSTRVTLYLAQGRSSELRDLLDDYLTLATRLGIVQPDG